jgi:hypothetical protein
MEQNTAPVLYNTRSKVRLRVAKGKGLQLLFKTETSNFSLGYNAFSYLHRNKIKQPLISSRALNPTHYRHLESKSNKTSQNTQNI